MVKNLLLLHGALGSRTQFIKLKKRLDPYFNVQVFNFSGHGNTPSTKEFSMELFQDDVLRFMKEHSLESATIFGYSMGGYVALKLAIEFPEKVQKLMTLGTKIQWDPETSEQEIKRLDPQKMQDKIPQFVEALKKEHHPNHWKGVVNKTARMMRALGNGKALEVSEFKKIGIPVLVSLGSEDSMVSKEETTRLVQNLKKGTFLEIQGFKHPIAQVDKTALANILIDFLQEKQKDFLKTQG